jgi:uncharacterized 2Fe-2S/4Fe-4S cluster protein (DUF4445 family)
MSIACFVELLPSGRRIPVVAGTDLKEILFAEGFEFPCAGREECGRCRVRVLQGAPAPSEKEQRLLSVEELRDGWRLGCRIEVVEPLTLELPPCNTPILADDTPINFPGRVGKGAVIDLGTTTLVAQLIDLKSSQILGTETALNPQVIISTELIGRILYTIEEQGGLEELTLILRQQVGELLTRLVRADSTDKNELKLILISGNTVMHHLFSGLAVDGLATTPFTPTDTAAVSLSLLELGWDLPGTPEIVVLPCLGGFVGSDTLAGVLATRIGERQELSALIDLGTNGEVVVGNREGLLCASTAAGPSFEGGRVSMGMRAASGAIDSVDLLQDEFRCHVIGDTAPRGICGSGLLDAVAAGLTSGRITPSGRFGDYRQELMLEPPVKITQRDVRELQLAKGAIASALECLLEELGAEDGDLHRVYLAGAFGHRLRAQSAVRIGLLPVGAEKIRAVGNTALFGTRLALFEPDLTTRLQRLRDRIQHVPLNEVSRFEEVFVRQLNFPDRSIIDREEIS